MLFCRLAVSSPPMTAFSTNIPGYEIIRELGVGGMANVYLAIQRSLDRKVAIKVMKRNIDDLEKFERRFLVEGRTMAKLPHRNIVAVYDIVKNDEVTYIAMEFLDGGTLSTKMKEGLSLADAISVVVQIAQALQFAHEHGIVHRDLKPANIMFRDVHTPVLTDFGIAKQQDATATRLTQTGMLVGTPTYMSPEQINAIDVDGRSDLYSLGILFYELLTGAPPFHADTPIAVLMAHLTTPPPQLPAGFIDFQPVLDKMLAKSRDDRFPSLKDFTRALKGAVVNNQNLWTQLQGDPNASSSEQLRALGFSGTGDSYSGAGASGEIRLPPSGRGGGRTPTPGPVSLQTPGMATGQQQMPRRPVWIWAGAAVVVLGIGITAFLLWPSGGADPAQKKVADIILAQAEQQIAARDWAKAVETIGLAAETAPNYEKVGLYTKQVVDALKGEAEQALGRNDLDTALAFTEQAKLLDPKDATLGNMTLRIAQQRNQAAAEKEVGAYITRAEEASRAGKDLGAGGAYSILSEALAKSPQNARVKQQLEVVVARALKPVRDALARGDTQAALAGLNESEGTLANDPAWQKLRTDANSAIESQAARVRLATVLQTIDAQIAANKLVRPGGDNAQETLARALALDAKSPEVLRRQDALANALTQSAQRALDAGQIEIALQGANEALNVKDGFAAALTVKRSAESKLSADQAKVIEGLAAANQALAEQRFLSPPGRNARELLGNVLKLEPRNEEAFTLMRELPKRIADAASARAAAGDVDEAMALVDEARKAYPADMELSKIGADLSKKLADAKLEQQRIERLTRISQLLAARPLKPENIGTAAKDIGALIQANPLDVDAVTARSRLYAVLDESLAAATSTAELDTTAAALKQAQAVFINEPKAQELAAKVDQTRQRIVAEEQARLAALSGELVIDAYPWASVASVVDANKQAVKLPADASTPLRLKVPAGVYTITFSHPSVPRGATKVAQVQAQKSITSTASFSSISGQDYLKRAGW